MSGQGYLDQPHLHTQAPYRAALLTQPVNARKALDDAIADPSKTLFGIAHGIPSVFVTKVGFCPLPRLSS
jgi:4-hydroxy-2-oxoheptanedioate aldolase